MVIYYLTCADKNEGTNISQALLEKKLIACARQTAVNSTYWWDGKINNSNEVLLMMESREDKFDAIQRVVTELHSYDEYVLTSVAIQRTTPGVEKWLDDTLA